MKGKRKLLVSSFLMIVTCCLLFAGTTFAWFSDSVSSNNNVIVAGNLDVEFDYWDGKDWVEVKEDSAILDGSVLWEPGVTEVAYLRITNAGSLAFMCNFGVNIIREEDGVNVDGKAFKLSDYIYFDLAKLDVTDEAAFAPYASRKEAMEHATNSRLVSQGFVKDFSMSAGDELYYAMVVYMPESVGNEANHNGVNKPEIQLGINVMAAQFSEESDSFDEYYDSLATYPDGAHRVLDSMIEAEVASGEVVNVSNNSKTFKVKAKTGAEGKVSASIAVVQTHEATAAIVDETGANVVSYQINVSGQELDSEVEVQVYVGKSMMGVNVYHNGKVMGAGDYNYDPASGFVTIASSDFASLKARTTSTFDITFNECDSIISSYEDFIDWDNLYQPGSRVVGADFAADDMLQFFGTIENNVDLNGHTITASNQGQYAIGVCYGATLTIGGNGTVNAGKGFMLSQANSKLIINGGTYNTTQSGTLNNIKHTSLAQNNTTIIINGGTFTTNVNDAVLFFATSNARIEINGGFFENTVDKTPDLLGMGTNKYNTNRIVITGGTFVNYNPLEDRMMYTGAWPANGEAAFSGPWMLIPGDYTVVSETQSNGDVWYSVVPRV